MKNFLAKNDFIEWTFQKVSATEFIDDSLHILDKCVK